MDTKEKVLRTRAKGLSPSVQIGKNGLTQGSIDQIDHELELRKLIKVKMFAGALPEGASKSDRRALANVMATKTRSQVIEQVGNIVVLHRG